MGGVDLAETFIVGGYLLVTSQHHANVSEVVVVVMCVLFVPGHGSDMRTSNMTASQLSWTQRQSLEDAAEKLLALYALLPSPYTGVKI